MVLPLVWLAVQALAMAAGPEAAVLFRVETLATIGRSLALALGVATLCVAISLPLAWLTHATDLPGRRFFRIGLGLPLAVPSYVSGFVVVAVLGPTGWLQQALAPLGIGRMPEIYGGLGATLALLFTYPYALIPMQAALARTDPRHWEAARSLGASPVRTFRTVVLPGLRPAMAGGGLLVALYALSDFGAVSLLRFQSLSYVIYLRYRSLFDRGEAIYLAVVLALLAVVVLFVQRRVAGRARAAVGARGGARRWPIVALGRWRWPAFAYCAAVFTVGVGLPLSVVSLWLFRGMSRQAVIGDLGAETLATVGVGALAAGVTVAVAAIPALLTRYGHPVMSRTVHGAAHVGYALPGIVVALALVYFATRTLPAVYQTHFLLLFAYVVLFLPLALSSLTDGLGAQDPRLYEAARILGCSPASAWRRVVLPVARPAVWAGLLVVFMSVIKELPATLLLSPIGFRTLATRIWSLTEDAFFAAAAPAIGVLLLLAGLALALRPDTRLKPPGPVS
jgi:iron(III) transport system permease protein